MGEIIYGDNLSELESMEAESIDMIYIHPPFNTGKEMTKKTLKTKVAEDGDRTGFQGKRFSTELIAELSFNDKFDDFWGFLGPRLEQGYRVLGPTGSFLVHMDYREIHYCKVFMDSLFGRKSFKNEIIWAFDYGARTKKKWPAKHHTILWYAKDPNNYTFNYYAVDRIPYMSNTVPKDKLLKGKTPTDVWWHTVVPTSSPERTKYPTQVPLGIINRIVKVHSHPNDTLLDYFAGSGTLGEAAAKHNRNFILIDNNPAAIQTMITRLANYSPTLINCDSLQLHLPPTQTHFPT